MVNTPPAEPAEPYPQSLIIFLYLLVIANVSTCHSSRVTGSQHIIYSSVLVEVTPGRPLHTVIRLPAFPSRTHFSLIHSLQISQRNSSKVKTLIHLPLRHWWLFDVL